MWGGAELLIIQTFRLWNWLFYFCLGGYIKYCHYENIRFVFIILMFLLNVVFQEILAPFIGTEYCEYFYSSFVVMVLSGMIFKYIIDRQIRDGVLLKNISALFLPVYTSHMFIISYTNKLFSNIDLGYVEPLIFWIFVSFITIIVSYFIMRTPIVNKIFRL